MQIAKKMLNRKALKKAFLQRGCLFQRDTGGTFDQLSSRKPSAAQGEF